MRFTKGFPFIQIDQEDLLQLKSFLLRLFGKVRLKDLAIFIVIQIVLAVAAFIIFGLMPIKKESVKITSTLDSALIANQINLSTSENELLTELRKAKRFEEFLQAKFQISKGDSIALIIDIQDSLAILCVKGVTIFESKIQRFVISEGIKQIPDQFLSTLFKGPILVKHDFSTIEKYPIVIKKAPKDTLEAQMIDSAPVVPISSDVFYYMEFENNFSLEIRQSESDFVGHKKPVRLYHRKKQKKALQNYFDNIFKKNSPGYEYRIIIEIPREDARAIYRAIPIKPQVLIRYR